MREKHTRKDHRTEADVDEQAARVELATVPVWLSWEVLWLLRDMPTMACILAPMLERLFLSSVPTVPTAVSDWLPSVFSRLHMSPLMLVLLVMFTPLEDPICLFFILDAKSLSATAIVGGGGAGRGEREEAQGRGWKEEGRWEETRKEFRYRSSWLTVRLSLI